jgi:high-affinity iron transporter
VHAGWLAAVPAGIATFFVVDRLISLSAARREVMEAALALLAAAVLFSVSFWMISRAESRHWMGYLKRGVAQSLSRHNLALLAGLAFLAVYREAAETILFTQALLMEVPRRTEVFAGAAVGLGVVLVLAFGLNRAVVRLPLGPFFAVSGVLLCGLAVSFAGAGVYGLVEAGTLRPRPVPVPEVAWMGIHPDLASLLVQTTIVVVIAWSGLLALRRAQHAPPRA